MDLDRENLANEFNIDFDDNSSDNDNFTIDINNPNEILKRNIERANSILDRILIEMESGNFSSRLAEVSSYLITSINNSVDSLYKKNYNDKDILLKERMVSLKEKETLIKLKLMERKNDGVKNQNIIFTDRETILKVLKDGENKLIENKQINDERNEVNDEQ